MTIAAIVWDYEEVKDKRAQIQILADMNLCEKKEIEKILSQNGCELPVPKVRCAKRRREKPCL
ncbi:hypothetical protein AALB52_05840 [Lachnospiraceae bacterium 38-14]